MTLSIWMRFLIYGMIGWCFEIAFTGIKHLIRSRFRNWSLFGKSYIWMLPIYGLAAFLFEPVHNALRSCAWPFRGVVYTAGFFAVEFVTGWILKLLTGSCPWDYTNKTRYHVKGFIRWDYAPIWFGFCFVLEQLHDLLLRVRIV